MRLWWCIHRPIVSGEDEVRPGNSLTGSPAEEPNVCAHTSAMAPGLNSTMMSFCQLSPHLQDHQALTVCDHQLPLQHTLQSLPQLTSQQQLHTKLNESAVLDSQYFISFDELAFHQVIGQGSFKSVFRGRWRNTNVAIVRLKKGGFLMEARLMQKLSTHPNLVQFYRWSQDAQGNEYIVLELVPLGSLISVLLRFGEVLRMRVRLSIAEQIAAAMAELHQEGVLHRDLAARNVLVQSLDPVHVKVADFGLAHCFDCQSPYRQYPSSDSSVRSQTSAVLQLDSIPVRWCAPEVISHQAWGPASDVWAFGVTLWEVFADGAEPYAMHSDAKVVEVVLSGGRLPRPARCPREVYSLMMQCWATDPDHRPTFDKILTIFSHWRQEHIQQSQATQQVQVHASASPTVTCSPAPAAHPLRHAQSWTPQQAADTPFSSIRGDSSAHSGDCVAPSSQLQQGALPGGQLPRNVGTQGVCRSLSEPLPSWDINQQAEASLQSSSVGPHQHQPGYNCGCLVKPLCTGTCCRGALLKATCSQRCSDSSSSVRGSHSHVVQEVEQPCGQNSAAAPVVVAAALRAAGRVSSSGSHQPVSCSNKVWTSCTGLDEASLQTHNNLAASNSSPAAGHNKQQQQQCLQEGQQPGQQLSYVCVSQPASAGSCLSRSPGVWSTWFTDGSDYPEVPVRVGVARESRALRSVEMSFDLERMIDPNDTTCHQQEEFTSIFGSWDPLRTAARTWSFCSSRSSSNADALAKRPIVCGLQMTALYGHARDVAQVRDQQRVGSHHQAQTAAADLARSGLVDCGGVGASGTSAGATWHNVPETGGYVDVRSVVYGGQELAC